MNINEKTVRKIKNVLSVAEQGVGRIPYEKVEVMADGPNGVKQITLSIGFTQYGGNLGKVIEEYVKREGKYSEQLGTYVSKLKSTDTVYDKKFKNYLSLAGKEDSVMGEVQEELFEKLYMGPAIRWGEKEGFTEPYSFLIVCDSFLHSGKILASIRNKFSEKTPANGGRERLWIESYVNARHIWLSGHSNSLIRSSSYRTKYYLDLLKLGDWNLDKIHTVTMNGVKILEIV